jgi:cyclic pyranopterin phosphate synthase
MKTPQVHFLDQKKIELETTLQKFNEKKFSPDSFCIMPFVNIILEPDGNIGICRHKGHNFTFGNIREKSIDEIWESKEVQAWREGHLTGNPEVCKHELHDRNCNLCPELNKLLPFAELNNTKNPKILRLTANLNGQCNLQCQMCTIWQLPNGFYNEENFWIPARQKFFSSIMEVDLLSGEHLFRKIHFVLLMKFLLLTQTALGPSLQIFTFRSINVLKTI